MASDSSDMVKNKQRAEYAGLRRLQPWKVAGVPAQIREKNLISPISSPKTRRLERGWRKDLVNHETQREPYQAGTAALGKTRSNRFWHFP